VILQRIIANCSCSIRFANTSALDFQVDDRFVDARWLYQPVMQTPRAKIMDPLIDDADFKSGGQLLRYSHEDVSSVFVALYHSDIGVLGPWMCTPEDMINECFTFGVGAMWAHEGTRRKAIAVSLSSFCSHSCFQLLLLLQLLSLAVTLVSNCSLSASTLTLQMRAVAITLVL